MRWINLTVVTRVLKQGQPQAQNHVFLVGIADETHFLCSFCCAH